MNIDDAIKLTLEAMTYSSLIRTDVWDKAKVVTDA